MIRENRRPQRDSNLSGARRRQPWHDADLHRLSRRFREVRTWRVVPCGPAAFRRGEASSGASWQPRGNETRRTFGLSIGWSRRRRRGEQPGSVARQTNPPSSSACIAGAAASSAPSRRDQSIARSDLISCWSRGCC
jgi:hypothetical protein